MSAFRKTRILYVNHTAEVSGAEKVLTNILRGLDRARYEPYVLCPVQGDLVEEIKTIGVEWLPLRPIHARFAWRPDRLLRSIGSILKAVIIMRKQIRVVDPDLIHANSVRAGIAASLAAMGWGKPVIWHVHDTLPRHPVSSAIRMFVWMARGIRVIAVSDATARRMRGRLPLGTKVRTIRNGTDLARFPCKQPGNSAFRASIGLSEKEFLVCAVGQICARKGLLELIEAFRQILPEAPHMHLAIVGKVVFQHEEQYLDALYAAVKQSRLEGRVHFTGELCNVSPALRAADLLVLNSRDEPFGLVLIEAMASGTPVLATRVGGIPEIVTDPENGWLVESGDTAALSSRLLELSRNRSLLVQVAQTALRATCPKFSCQRFQNELLRFYAEVDPNSDLRWDVRKRPALARSGNN